MLARFNAHIIPRGLANGVPCMVFAAVPVAQRDSKCSAAEKPRKNLVRQVALGAKETKRIMDNVQMFQMGIVNRFTQK